MGWQRKQGVFKAKDQVQSASKQIQREEQTPEPGLEEVSPGSPKLLTDARLAHPANMAQRTKLLQAGQKLLGNQKLQRLLRTDGTATKRASPLGSKSGSKADPVTKVAAGVSAPSHRRSAEEGETMWVKGGTGQAPEASFALKARLDALRGGGQPLPGPTRSFFEPRFGRDLGKVRIHTDGGAAAAAEQVNARAFTLGQDIVFGAGQYAPGTTTGRQLLAHELTHVIQQGSTPALQRQVRRDLPVPEKTKAPPLEEEPVVSEEQDTGPAVLDELESLPEDSFVSYDMAPTEAGPEQTKVAASSVDLSSTRSPHILPADHPSEREADAVAQAIMTSPEKGGCPRINPISSAGAGFLQRQIYWENQSTVAWADFTAKAPKGSPYDAQIYTGIKGIQFKTHKEAHPHPPILPTPCKIGNKPSTQHHAVVGLDILNLNVRAYMQPSKSWVKPGQQTAALLAHEQGHYDISNVISEKTEMALLIWGISHAGTATKCGKNAAINAATQAWNQLKPNQNLTKIWKKGMKLHKKAQKDYDNDTVHGTNAANQKKWQGSINADLPSYSVL